LRHEANAAKHGGALGAWRAAVDGDTALVNILAQQAANQRGFTRAVRTDQGNALAKGDIEMDAVEHTGVLEGLGEVVAMDHGWPFYWANRG